MLQELSVQDFAIIRELRLPFREGMTVLTGETGAGKSIIIDAMGLLVGGRGSADYIRDGAERCRIEGSFFIKEPAKLNRYLIEVGIEPIEGLLVLQREIYRTGRNNCRINGQLVTTKVLRELGRHVVDIHGQNEHQELMHPGHHLRLLDQYKGELITPLYKKYREGFISYQELTQRLEKVRNNEKAYVQRLDMLQFQFEEIESAQLVVGEEEHLLEERRKLMNFQKITEALQTSYSCLGENDVSSLDLTGMAMNEMATIENIDDSYKSIAELLRTAYYSMQEALTGITSSLDMLELDEERLVEVDTRLDTIRQLKRKYGETVEQILNYATDIEKELSLNAWSVSDMESMEKEQANKKRELEALAEELTWLRQEAAKNLETDIMAQLSSLYMENTVFKVNIERSAELTLAGRDRVEFYISTNIGESLRPLVKVASGGELSRMMLALKTIFSQSQSMTSIVFDEVDTGVSGRVAQAIAEKIHQIGEQSQVLCITHLPQVAAKADTQYFIQKTVTQKRTETSVKELSEQERVDEIARMLSGSEITTLTKDHAQELLNLAKK